ncbi:hypothetical protein DYB37_010381 [Aphanomyces astaci]|uniref:C3H1-type domain-containing protein n=1 Tax=Aphanomyces astaci TaxID=112090 RepID=A0A418DZF7_APHAT|nr:hypothetical protein DYB35_010000 [Aphanomyces astaci]RHZ13372.1 hypothetical protein DYB37_010381 [Aphanomyces astaci]
MSWQEQLATISSLEERELFAVLRRYGASRVFSPSAVQRPCTLVLRVVPSDPEFPFRLENGLVVHVHVPLAYPQEPAAFSIECDSVPGFQAKFAHTIAAHLHDRQALFPGQLVLRKTLTWLDNNLRLIIQPPRPIKQPPPIDDVVDDNIPIKAVPSSSSAATSTIGPTSPEEPRVYVEPATSSLTAAMATTPLRRCRYFAAGTCTQGSACLFAHTLPVNPRVKPIATKGTPLKNSYTATPTATRTKKRGKAAAATNSTATPVTALATTTFPHNQVYGPATTSPNDPFQAQLDNDSQVVVAADSLGQPVDSTAKSVRRRRARRKQSDDVSPPPSILVDKAKSIQPPPLDKSAKASSKKPIQLCRFFGRGDCNQGDACRFTHAPSSPDKANTSLVAGEEERVVAEDDYDLSPPFSDENPPEDNNVLSHNNPRAVGDAATLSQKGPWTSSQQAQLDMALKAFPPGSFDKARDRWHAIAECVDGRSLKECVGRFKVLSEYVKSSSSPTTIAPPPYPVAVVKSDIPKIIGLAAARRLLHVPDSPHIPPGKVPAAASSAPSSSMLETQTDDNDSNSEREDEARDARLVPASLRVKLDLEVDPKAIHLHLNGLFLHQVDTLQLYEIKCAFQCAQCPLAFDAVLSLTKHSIRQWCRRCSVLQTVDVRPVLMHAGNQMAMNLHLINCTLVDVMPPSVFLAVCSSCAEVLTRDI